jgi:hypothetical protein
VRLIQNEDSVRTSVRTVRTNRSATPLAGSARNGVRTAAFNAIVDRHSRLLRQTLGNPSSVRRRSQNASASANTTCRSTTRTWASRTGSLSAERASSASSSTTTSSATIVGGAFSPRSRALLPTQRSTASSARFISRSFDIQEKGKKRSRLDGRSAQIVVHECPTGVDTDDGMGASSLRSVFTEISGPVRRRRTKRRLT